MICKPCGVAGDLIAEARKMDFAPNVVMTLVESNAGVNQIRIHNAVRSVAHLFHGKCPGSTKCDCQHIVDMEGKRIQS
jgi:hypothetical protein